MTVRLPYAMQKRGGLLLHQQCWLWGQDIRRKEGNILLHKGFVRSRPPVGVEGSSQYTMQLPDALQVRLWGFGLYYGSDQGVYLNRYSFRPLHAIVANDVWTPKPFTRLTPSQDFSAIAESVRWIAGYEESVQHTLGTLYRDRCLAAWSNRALSPLEFIYAWRRFSDELGEFAEIHRTHAPHGEGAGGFFAEAVDLSPRNGFALE